LLKLQYRVFPQQGSDTGLRNGYRVVIPKWIL
jgi:hypothetical protein